MQTIMTPLDEISLWIGLAPEKIVKPASLRLPYKTTSDEDVGKLITHCNLQSLTSLNISMCKISDEALQKIAQSCPQLEKLDASFCGGISHRGVTEIMTACTRLQLLSLGGCKQISEEGLKSIPWENSQISTLDIGYCEKITFSGIQNIAARCGSLNSLNLAQLEINDQEIKTLVESKKTFSDITLSFCKNISPAFLKKIKEKHPNVTITY